MILYIIHMFNREKDTHTKHKRTNITSKTHCLDVAQLGPKKCLDNAARTETFCKSVTKAAAGAKPQISSAPLA